MGIIKVFYKLRHKGVREEEIPPQYNISLWTGIKKPIRKWMSAVFVPTIPFNNLRVSLYRMCGYKIGKGTFIGMRCYLDDLCYDKIEIGKNVTISYGVFFACHGRKQDHNRIVIEDGAYIGMRASIIAPEDVTIGAGAIVGAASLVNRSVGKGEVVAGVPARSLQKKSLIPSQEDIQK